MNNIIRRLSLLIFPTFLTFLVFRSLFLWKYWEHFEKFSFGELTQAFLHGIRFDFGAIAMTLGVLGLVLFWLKGRLLVFFYFLCSLIWSGVLLMSVADLICYGVSHQRISFEIFTSKDNLGAAFLGVWDSYRLASIITILCMLGGIYAYTACGKVMARLDTPIHWFKRLSANVTFLLVFVVLGRGGFQTKPLTAQHALVNGYSLSHLTLNPVFISLRFTLFSHVKPFDYVAPDVAQNTVRSLLKTQEAQHYPKNDLPFYRQRKASQNPTFSVSPNTNIVLIVWESLGAFLTRLNPEADTNIVPNFNRLSRQGLLFDRFFANGVRSVEGMSALLSSLPAYDKFAFVMSPFQQNPVITLPRILKKNGYSTTFVHGTFPDSVGMHNYAKSTGFDTVITRDDFENYQDKLDGTWGVWDQYLFDRTLQEANAQQQPFFITAFTLSSHEPYVLPDDKFKKFDTPWFNGHHYTDWALGEFFKKASKQSWYQNTLFIVVADHTKHAESHQESAWIPLWMYKPDGSLPNQTHHQVGGQVDFLPTLLDLLNLEAFSSSTGKSLFASSEGFAMYDASDNVWFRSEKAYAFSENKLLGIYRWKTDPDFNNPLPQDASTAKEIQSYLSWRQLGHNALITNKMAHLLQD